MMIITPHGNKRSIEWHVGNKPPQIDWQDVVEIWIDGDELDWIQRHFTGLPATDMRGYKLVGLFAQTVVANMSSVITFMGTRKV
jgi:hypothetical protein